MSELDKLKVSTIKRPKIKRYLEDVHFDFEAEDGGLGPHVAMTSGLGAASLDNNPIMLKSIQSEKDIVTKNVSSEFTEEQAEILKTIGEWKDEYSIIKNQSNTNLTTKKEPCMKPDVIETVVIDNTVNEQVALLTKQMEELTKTNNILISKGLIKGFGFSEDIEKGVAEILATIKADDRELLVKAFEVTLAKAVNEKVAVAKSATEAENPLKTLLEKEAGFESEDSKNEIEKDTENKAVEKSLVDKLKEHLEARNTKEVK